MRATAVGGRAPNIILDDAELGEAIPAAIRAACLNSGQSCTAPTRILVPLRAMDDAVTLARAAAERVEVGAPESNAALLHRRHAVSISVPCKNDL